MHWSFSGRRILSGHNVSRRLQPVSSHFKLNPKTCINATASWEAPASITRGVHNILLRLVYTTHGDACINQVASNLVNLYRSSTAYIIVSSCNFSFTHICASRTHTQLTDALSCPKLRPAFIECKAIIGHCAAIVPLSIAISPYISVKVY